ncbi:group II intron maturase-specific domain-containing protein [Streptomyces sp. NPDC050263]|uniref:group II intron maturase-specific domain-containing protein n=1 Tax=Streptomyces sp. NPDC050263 TaxID=3155037 RepID=UPI00342CC64B
MGGRGALPDEPAPVTGEEEDHAHRRGPGLPRLASPAPLEVLLHRLNRVLRGWTAYFRFGVSHASCRYLRHFVWQRVIKWLRRKLRRRTWKDLRRRYCGGRWWPVTDEVRLFDPTRVKTIRYLYRGTKIPSPWPGTG